MTAGSTAKAGPAFGFQVARTIYPGGQPLQMAVADFNGDRRKDLLVLVDTTPSDATTGLEFRVFLQNEDHVPAAPPRIIPVAEYADALVTADFNRDGRQDVILSVPSGPLIALGTADGSLAWQAPAPRFHDHSSQAVATDFDLDGDPDVVMLQSGELYFYANDGLGRFAQGISAGSAGWLQRALRADADLSGDGLQDLVVSAAENEWVIAAAGGRMDQFTQVFHGGWGTAVSIATGDWNSDGRDDLAMGLDSLGFIGAAFQGQAGGLGTPEPLLPAFHQPKAMVRADLQGDGSDDLVVGWNRAGVGYHPQGNGVLGEAVMLGIPDGYPAIGENYSRPLVAVGDLMGGGCEDILWADWAPWIHIYVGENCRRPAAATHDVDADRRGEIFWRHSSGAHEMWRGAQLNQRVVLAPLAAEWRLVAMGDFDGNGKADAFWRNTATGANDLWRSADQSLRLPVLAQADTAWTVAGAGDFDNDGRDDLFWRHAGSGANRVWRSADGRLPIDPGAVADPNWQVAGVGDFTGDAKDDVLWRNAATGANDLWASGLRTQRRALTSVTSLDWKIAGVADFNGDGVADILWRHATTGANVMWMFGRANAQRRLPAVDPQWQVAATADYDGDGKADILWRHKLTGANELWSEGNVRFRKVLPAVATAWSVVGR